VRQSQHRLRLIVRDHLFGATRLRYVEAVMMTARDYADPSAVAMAAPGTAMII
jgi:hypothetical protein